MSNEDIPVEADVTPEETPKEVELQGVDEIVKINLDDVKENSVLVIKINQEGPMRQVAANQIANALMPLREQIKEKNIVLIVMGKGESMETLEEEQMNQIGWERKGRIITKL